MASKAAQHIESDSVTQQLADIAQRQRRIEETQLQLLKSERDEIVDRMDKGDTISLLALLPKFNLVCGKIEQMRAGMQN